jgi:carboxylesterase
VLRTRVLADDRADGGRVAQVLSTEAFRVAGGTRGGALLVHGFTGTPHEMRPLAEPLAAAGFDVLGVRLPGHGAAVPGEPNDAGAWRSAVAAGLAELEAPRSRPIVVVGLSMGALLALDIAIREPARVRAVVALSPAIKLARIPGAILRVGRLAPGGFRRRLLPRGQSDIRDPAVRETHPKSDPFPVSAALSLDSLRGAVRARIPALAQPLLIVHSRLDRTCPLSGARWLAARARASEVEMHVLERSGHVIPVDLEGEVAIRLVVDFVSRRATETAGASRTGI